MNSMEDRIGSPKAERLPPYDATPSIERTGYFEPAEKPVDMKSVMREINDTLKQEEARQLYRKLRLHQ